MNYNAIIKLWLIPLSCIFYMFLSISLGNAQGGTWQIHLGYEHLLNSEKLTNGIAQNTYTWIGEDGIEEYFQMNAGPVNGYKFGVQYNIFDWWSIELEHRRLYRTYYLVATDPRSNHLDFIDYSYWRTITEDKFLGTSLNMYSWGLKLNFAHDLFKNDGWNMHYFLGFNLDQYENNRRRRDVPIFFSLEGPDPDDINVPYSWETKGRINVVTDYNGAPSVLPSLNFGLGISRKIWQKVSAKFELGYRYISFTENILPPINALTIDMEHQRYTYNEQMDRDVFLSDETNYNFPLYLGGIYFNISCVYELSCRENQNVKE